MSRDKLLDEILVFQRKLEKYASSEETDKVLFYIHKLKYRPITVKHLEATGVGRTVNSLRHHGGMVGSKARDLVNKWKKMVSAESSEEEVEPEEEEEEEVEEEVESQRRTDGDNGVALREQNGDDVEEYEDEEEDDDRLQIEENGSESNPPVPDYRPTGSDSYEYGDESPGGVENSYNPITSQRDYQLNTTAAPSAEYHPSSLGSNKSIPSSPEEERLGWDDASPSVSSDRRNESSSKSSSKKISKEDKHRKKDKHRDKEKSKDSSGSQEKEKKKEHKHKAKHKDKDKDREDKKSKSKSKHKDKDRHDVKTKEKSHEENGEKSRSDKEKKHIVNGYGPVGDEAESSKSQSAKHERKEVEEKRKEKSSSNSHRKVERSREKERKEVSQERESCSDSEVEVKDTRVKDSSKNKEKSKHHSKHSSSSSSSSKKDKVKHDAKNHQDSQREDEGKKKKSKHSKDEDNDFGAALMGYDSPSKKKKKKKKKERKERESSDDEQQQPSSSKSHKRVLMEDEELPDTIKKPKLLESTPQKLPKLPTSMVGPVIEDALLPEINPNYKPLPRVPQKMDLMNELTGAQTDDDIFKIMLQQKGKRSKMYSGRVTGLTYVPKLFDIAMRTAIENIDFLNLRISQHLAYDIIRPILEKSTPQQLLYIEDTVPHLLEDTDQIWENHCKKDFRNKALEDMETWREMWLRCSDERDKKLKSLTANWQKKFVAKAEPKRQTKLAFVNDTVKVPKSVARAQAKYGTAVASTSSAKPGKAAEVAARKTAMHNAQRAEKAAAAPRPPSAKNKKVAPLMAKTRQFYKKTFRR